MDAEFSSGHYAPGRSYKHYNTQLGSIIRVPKNMLRKISDSHEKLHCGP